MCPPPSCLTVAVCHAGSLGTQVIRLLADHPSLRLIALLVHDPAKAGVDAGTLAGIEPLGVLATTHLQQIVDIRPDCAIWMGRGWQPDVMCTLLRAGVNVYTPVGAWYLPGAEDFDTIEAACRIGASTVVGGGTIPGLVSDVLPLFLSGYVGRVRAVRAQQSNLIGDYPSGEQLRTGLGFGEPVPAPGAQRRDHRWIAHVEQSANMVGDALGIELGPVVLVDKQYAAAPRNLLLPNGLRLRKGTVAGVRWVFTAADRTGVPFYTLTKEQVAVTGLGADWRATAAEPQWRVAIDGDPGLDCTISPASDGGFGVTTAEVNAARAVNLVPYIVSAPPGCRSTLDFPAVVGTAGRRRQPPRVVR